MGSYRHNIDLITTPCIYVPFSGYTGMGQNRPGQLSGRPNDTSGARNHGRRHNDNKSLLWKRRYPEVKGGGRSPSTRPTPGLNTPTPAACPPRCLPLRCPGWSWQPIFPRRLNQAIYALGRHPKNRSPLSGWASLPTFLCLSLKTPPVLLTCIEKEIRGFFSGTNQLRWKISIDMDILVSSSGVT